MIKLTEHPYKAMLVNPVHIIHVRSLSDGSYVGVIGGKYYHVRETVAQIDSLIKRFHENTTKSKEEING